MRTTLRYRRSALAVAAAAISVAALSALPSAVSAGVIIHPPGVVVASPPPSSSSDTSCELQSNNEPVVIGLELHWSGAFWCTAATDQDSISSALWLDYNDPACRFELASPLAAANTGAAAQSTATGSAPIPVPPPGCDSQYSVVTSFLLLTSSGDVDGSVAPSDDPTAQSYFTTSCYQPPGDQWNHCTVETDFRV